MLKNLDLPTIAAFFVTRMASFGLHVTAEPVTGSNHAKARRFVEDVTRSVRQLLDESSCNKLEYSVYCSLISPPRTLST